MSGERVSVFEGKKPIIVVAPHGFQKDDEQTAVIAEYLARRIGCFGVVNRGWERDEAVDIYRDKADCNNVAHCFEDVVREEFLEPIVRFRNRIGRKHSICHIFYIHGMANRHRLSAGDPGLDMVIGYGAGMPDSYSCDVWRKDALVDLLRDAGMNVYQGRKGGLMSGWARNNLNQLYRKWWPDKGVQSMQIEIIHDMRQNKEIAELTAEYLAECLDAMLMATPRRPLSVKEY